ncbi:hypothetical protein SIL08_21685 [Scandinavium sp. V105_16]|uniref:Uncharacterized protein n=1 Tax=Scandinavium lactucae TaxID=3095028 RepID=A0AAJ2VYT7_9ENTR|nr:MULTISPECIES: hypothetical protein [unclassified Scandinavium]MDX6022895.1 hypothetical protein [Scandinavium sp. V105_16]MDX6033263.1 hypothetical protein [Scandinavium sp. V105_12]
MLPTAVATLSPLGIHYLLIAFREVYNGHPITRLLERAMKLLIASLLMLFFPRKGFEWFIRKMYPNEYLNPNFSESSCHLRKKLRSAAKYNFLFFAAAMIVIWSLWQFEFSMVNTIKAASAYIALTVSIGRGGWSLQTWDGNTLSERIDQLIYKMAQYINVLILLVTIYYPNK